MIKLYRSRFTAKQLRDLASHCYSFFAQKGANLNGVKVENVSIGVFVSI